jgi:hypothetical protein
VLGALPGPSAKAVPDSEEDSDEKGRARIPFSKSAANLVRCEKRIARTNRLSPSAFARRPA